ncbi:MAG: aldo/keto reductase [Christensenellaceae bacterium]|jgi:predicted aldo/keto reductase-like oxidoreductase
MNYSIHPKSKDAVSLLAYGCMRFTKRGGNIVQEKAEEELLHALKSGVNYFDTAYIYGGNEAALGAFFAKGHRKDIYLATKLPHFRVSKLEDVEKIFNEELRRLQTDYIDYYLMHMLPEAETWARLVSLGIKDWSEEKKRQGMIRHIGFSFHGGTEDFMGLIDAYGWDFCQIQYNYMDEYAQAGVSGLRYAYEKNIPVFIMEPLRGGRLTHELPAEAKKIFTKAHPDWSPAEWALRWLYQQKEVFSVLSGMNALWQIDENVRVASLPRENLLSAADYAVIAAAKEIIDGQKRIDCTGCGYCMPCPAGVDIPVAFRCYNNIYTDRWFTGFKQYLMQTTFKKNNTAAGNCISCGLCTQKCPQHLAIPTELKKVQKKMETPLYKLVRFVAKWYAKF